MLYRNRGRDPPGGKLLFFSLPYDEYIYLSTVSVTRFHVDDTRSDQRGSLVYHTLQRISPLMPSYGTELSFTVVDPRIKKNEAPESIAL